MQALVTAELVSMEEVSGQTPSAPWVWRCENLGFGSLDDNTLEVALIAMDTEYQREDDRDHWPCGCVDGVDLGADQG